MRIYVQNLQDKVEVGAALEATLTALLQDMASRLGVAAGAEMGLSLVDDELIASYNRQYRGIDAPTDVLSFALREKGEGEPVWEQAGPEELLGDVVISLQTAARQAGEYGHSLDREVSFLALHGLLHLLGFDHATPEGERQMERLAEEVLSHHGLSREEV